MRVALPRARACHAQSRAMIEVPRTILASPNIHPPPITGNAQLPIWKKTHFKKGLPWSSQRPFDIIFNRTFLGIRWSSNHHTTLLKIVAIFFYQAHWAWIFNSENKIEKRDRPSLLKMMRKLVYSRTNEEFNNELQTLRSNQTFLKWYYTTFSPLSTILLESWIWCLLQNNQSFQSYRSLFSGVSKVTGTFWLDKS